MQLHLHQQGGLASSSTPRSAHGSSENTLPNLAMASIAKLATTSEEDGRPSDYAYWEATMAPRAAIPGQSSLHASIAPGLDGDFWGVGEDNAEHPRLQLPRPLMRSANQAAADGQNSDPGLPPQVPGGVESSPAAVGSNLELCVKPLLQGASSNELAGQTPNPYHAALKMQGAHALPADREHARHRMHLADSCCPETPAAGCAKDRAQRDIMRAARDSREEHHLAQTAGMPSNRLPCIGPCADSKPTGRFLPATQHVSAAKGQAAHNPQSPEQHVPGKAETTRASACMVTSSPQQQLGRLSQETPSRPRAPPPDMASGDCRQSKSAALAGRSNPSRSQPNYLPALPPPDINRAAIQEQTYSAACPSAASLVPSQHVLQAPAHAMDRQESHLVMPSPASPRRGPTQQGTAWSRPGTNAAAEAHEVEKPTSDLAVPHLNSSMHLAQQLARLDTAEFHGPTAFAAPQAASRAADVRRQAAAAAVDVPRHAQQYAALQTIHQNVPFDAGKHGCSACAVAWLWTMHQLGERQSDAQGAV